MFCIFVLVFTVWVEEICAHPQQFYRWVIFKSVWFARHFESSCKQYSLNDWKQTAQGLKLQERLLTINKRNIIRWNIYRDNNFIKVSLKILSLQAYSLSLCFKPASQCLLFSKMNSRNENRSKLSFTARIITKYSLERFLSICCEKLSKGFLKFCNLISNLILSQIIVSNLTNEHKLNSRINYARLH